MRNLFVISFFILLALVISVNTLSAQTKAQSPAPHDISGIWRILGPGVTGARFNSVGGGASHPSFGPDRPPLTPWGQEKWSQTRASGRQSKLAFKYLPDQKDWNDPLFLCDPSG